CLTHQRPGRATRHEESDGVRAPAADRRSPGASCFAVPASAAWPRGCSTRVRAGRPASKRVCRRSAPEGGSLPRSDGVVSAVMEPAFERVAFEESDAYGLRWRGRLVAYV